MIEETATVIAVEDDKIIVEAIVKSTCSSCNAQKNCGTGSIARAFSNKMQRLELSSPVPVNVGDDVIIGIHESSVVMASWLLYLLPIMTFFVSMLVVNITFSTILHELIVFIIALLPTVLCFRIVARQCRRLDKGRFQPVIIRRLVS